MLTLYKLSKTSKMLVWTIEDDYIDEQIVIWHGQEDGIMQEVVIDIETNKSNRTIEDQLELEFMSRVNKQLRLGYHYTRSEALVSTHFTPMLAKKFKDHKVNYPVLVQPKLDGLRCIAKKLSLTQVELRTRGNKLIVTLDHIEDELLPYMEVGDIVDGELYIHGIHLQTINSLVKRKQEGTITVEYHIFDAVGDKPFIDRQLAIPTSRWIKRVSHEIVNTPDELEAYRVKTVAEGYEGIIVRNPSTPYEQKRTKHLLKHKVFTDKEFAIVDVKYVTSGPDKGCAILVCVNEDGKRFKTIPKGSKKYRRSITKDVIGKEATVRFHGRSLDNVPVPNPVTIIIDRGDK